MGCARKHTGQAEEGHPSSGIADGNAIIPKWLFLHVAAAVIVTPRRRLCAAVAALKEVRRRGAN